MNRFMEFSPFSLNEVTDYVSDNSSSMAHYAGIMSILGSSTLCTSETYEYRFQTFSSISWSVTPARMFCSPSGGNGPVANLIRANPFVSGDATLTYTIEGECDNLTPRMHYFSRMFMRWYFSFSGAGEQMNG